MVKLLARRRSERTGVAEPVVAEAFWRGLDLFRPLAAAYACYLAWQRRDTFERPWVAVVVLGVVVLWSCGMLAYRRRTRRVVVAEVVIACGAILGTLWAATPEAIADGTPTLPTLWAAGSVVGAATLLGSRGGLIAALAVAVADIVEVGEPNDGTIHNIVLLFLLGGLIGLAVDLAREGQIRLEIALAEQERMRERERLARAVHDGVLQTLAFIHRRGQEIGGEASGLADLAAEQERSLRHLVSRPDPAPGQDDRSPDLGARLSALDGPIVHVVVPAGPVAVAAPVAEEVEAAVRAALDNVEKHAGPSAEAWILLEATAANLRITLRDNGTGADPEALAAAYDKGRMGVARSIRGRVEDLGGTAEWTTRPGGGCTVTLDVPRDLTSRAAQDRARQSARTATSRSRP